MAISVPKKIIKPVGTGAANAAEAVKFHMAEIARQFKLPKLTLVIRSPSFDGDIIVGNDDLDLAMAAIRKAAEQNSKQLVVKTN